MRSASAWSPHTGRVRSGTRVRVVATVDHLTRGGWCRRGARGTSCEAKPRPRAHGRVRGSPLEKGRSVATFTVWRFDSADGAERAIDTLQSLQSQELIKVHDAAVVSWPEGRRKPKTRQLHSLAGAGALGGAFWGMLFGLLFFVPLLGMAVGAAIGGLTGSLADVGIDDKFIAQVRESVTPGTSALFVLTSDAVTDRVVDAFAGTHPDLIHTNLSAEQESKLREVFAESEGEQP